MKVSDVIYLWDGNVAEFGRACGVSKTTAQKWNSEGRIPEVRWPQITYEVVPKQETRLRKMAAMDEALNKEFGRGLFEDE
jgi:hypothetical protein